MKNLAKIINDKEIHVYDKSQFDWYAIRNCGQIFRDPPCEIMEEADKIIIKATGDKTAAWLWNFFDLDTNYSVVKDILSQHTVLRQPIEAGGGIRILRQPFIECVISFIISANNNIKRFSKTLGAIGEFTLENLSRFTESDFKKIGCGYRAPYLVKAVKQLSTFSFQFSVLSMLSNDLLRKELMRLSGVGPKVADCVMLFAFHRLDIVPVDTWIKSAQEHIDFSQFEQYAGVAQQYVFFYLQHLRKEL